MLQIVGKHNEQDVTLQVGAALFEGSAALLQLGAQKLVAAAWLPVPAVRRLGGW
jgi:hypothetical protein